MYFAHMHRANAETCFQAARLLAPAEPRWPYFQGLLKLRHDSPMAEKRLREALALAEKAGSPPAERALPRFQLAELLISEGELESAQEQLDAIEPANETAQRRLQFDRGQLASCRGEWEKARVWKMGKKLHDQQPFPFYNR